MVSPATNISTYSKAGVRVDATNTALNDLTDCLRKTWPKKGFGQVLLDFGQYANVVDIGGGQGIAVCTDGVGSKALIAEMMGEYSTIGIDCIAMNVNDLICVGATPVTFVDYIAAEKVESDVLVSIGEGLARGAKIAGVSISGGEIAELPDMIRGSKAGHGFDLAGTAVGTVQTDKILLGKNIIPGDAVVGISSSGIHSNGMTLARKIFFKDENLNVNSNLEELEVSLGEELLKPTNIYVNESLKIIEKIKNLRAIFHITGDGFTNLLRGSAPVGFVLDSLPDPQPVFRSIAFRGKIPASEMYTVYNMGIGICVVVPENNVNEVIEIVKTEGKFAQRIGSVIDKDGQVLIPNNPLDGKDLISLDKYFNEA